MQLTLFALFLFIAQALAQKEPWVGQPRDAGWLTRHELLLNQTAAHKADLKVVFLGDSITEGWAGNGKEVWAKYYAPLHAYNYGIGGDRTEHVIWRIENKEFDDLKPNVVVLKIGTNNLGANTEEDIAHGVKEIIDQLFVKMPATKILLLAIIPRDGTLGVKAHATNKLIEKFGDDKKVFYLDMSPQFEDSPGKVKPDLYVPDHLHLSAKGYQVWHDTMDTLFKKLDPVVVVNQDAHPWVGEPKNETWWITTHENLVKQSVAHKDDIKVIFFGDSITQGWSGNGKEIWTKYYTPIHAYNYGIGGDRTEHLVWRVEHGEFDGLSAKVVVLKIGTNNLGANTAEDIAHGIKQVINVTLAKMPSAKILLLGVLPRAGEIETKVQDINTIISKYNDDKTIFYLDMSDKFQDSPGKEKAGLYVDTVHLTPAGYQVWYDTMEPLLKKLLGTE